MVPKTLGGVGFGMKISKADKAWGGKGDCDSSGGSANCTYLTKKSEDGNASISGFEKGKVFSAGINAGFNDKGKYVFDGPLMVFQTSEGIGLGDKGSKVKKAYPKAKKFSNQGYTVYGKGDSFMTFITGDGKHITGINMANGEQG